MAKVLCAVFAAHSVTLGEHSSLTRLLWLLAGGPRQQRDSSSRETAGEGVEKRDRGKKPSRNWERRW